ncbi:MAG: 3'-5' exonuclease [Ignavibacteria bacterium]|nr:3'-5' exonuclease [Ignavibacteria bacterium]
MLEQIDLTKVLILDIETVPVKRSYSDLDEKWKDLWERKMKFQINEDTTGEDLYERAGIYAEFGKIICISIGAFYYENSILKLKLKSFFNDDEKIILEEFRELLDTKYSADDKLLCAHNGKEFDFPFIARRCLINGISIPKILDTSGKKPWEVKHLDTMEMWKFGDYKSYTSLILLAAIFGIESPKDDIDGSQVGRIYWEENDLKRIEKYCKKDVITVAQILLKFKGMDMLMESDIIHADSKDESET